jgi:hypothetical protein
MERFGMPLKCAFGQAPDRTGDEAVVSTTALLVAVQLGLRQQRRRSNLGETSSMPGRK